MILKNKHHDNSKYNLYFIVLVLQISLFVFLNILWEYNSFIMQFNENAVHMGYVFDIKEWNVYKLIDAPYPRLIHYLTKPLLKIFTNEKWAFFSVSLIFVCINVIATYFCTIMLDSKKTALFAASALLWLPLTMTACRTYNLDYPQAAIITLWFLCFLKSSRFEKKIPSILFAILIFISSLIKYTYFTYIIPCFIGMVYHLYTNGRSDTIKQKHLAVSAIFLINAVLVFFNNGWIAGVKAAGIILTLEGLFLYRKDHGIGKLFILTGSSLIISNIFFCTFINPNLLKQLELYEQNTTFINTNLKYYNIVFFFSYLSLLLRAILIFIKAKILTPFLFWYFLLGFIFITGIPKLRHKYSLLLFPLLTSPLYMIFTSADDRYQYPLLSCYCIVSAVWLSGKSFQYIKYCLYVIGMIIVAFCGIYLSGGWLSETSLRLPAHLLTIGMGNSFEYNTFTNNFYRQNNTSMHYIVEFSKANTSTELLNLKSQWSDNLLYTFGTYDINWENSLEPLIQLPNESLLQTEILFKNQIEDEYRISSTLQFMLALYARINNKNIYFSEKGPYILTIQSTADIPIVDKTEELSKLSKEADIIKSWFSGNYHFTLYMRKTIK